MNDLIERINQLLARSEAFRPPEHVVDLLEDCREALKPVDDVKVEMLLCELIAVAEIHELPGYVYDVCAKSIDYITRLAREKKKLKRRPSVATHNALQEECDGRMDAIKQHDKDKISIGRNVQKMVREFDAERKELQATIEANYMAMNKQAVRIKELQAKVEELTAELSIWKRRYNELYEAGIKLTSEYKKRAALSQENE